MQTKKKLKIKRKATTLFDNLPRKYPKINKYSCRVRQYANSIKHVNCTNTLRSEEEKTSRVKYAIGSHARAFKAQLTSTSDGLIKESVGPVGFTPPIGSAKGCKVDECFIQNGPHQLSLLHLKSLEVFLTNGELSVPRSADKSFETG